MINKIHNVDPGDLTWVCKSRSWYGKELDFFHPWFLDNLDLQKTLWGKIMCWLDLEYKIWFEPRTSQPKCPTPLSSLKWKIQYNYWGKS